MTTTTVLLPCPFCNEGTYHKPDCWFELKEIGASKSRLMEAWNRRAANAKPDQVDATAQEFVRVPKEAYLWLMGMGKDGFTEDRRGAFWWRSAFNERAGLDMMAIWNGESAQPAQAQQEPVAWFEKSASGAWFLAYSFNPNAETRPLVFGDAAAQPVQPITDEREAFGDALDADAMLELRNRVLKEAALICMQMAGTRGMPALMDAANAIRSLQSPHIEVREQAPEKVGRTG